MKNIKGKVWKFGNNVNTDVMSPGFSYNMPWEERKKLVLHIHPAFTREAKPGDIIVAGKNWGCGSAREKAPINLRKIGISCVIAESFGRIYFRNSIALGLPSIVCPGISNAFQEGNTLELDIENNLVRNLTNGTELKYERIPEPLLTILDTGGIIPYLSKKIMCDQG